LWDRVVETGDMSSQSEGRLDSLAGLPWWRTVLGWVGMVGIWSPVGGGVMCVYLYKYIGLLNHLQNQIETIFLRSFACFGVCEF